MIEHEDFLNKKRFSMIIEEIVSTTNMGYIDAILDFCEKNGMEPNETSKFISNVLLQKIEAEAIEMNYLKGGNTLPI
jgi:hypothetical protein